MSAALREQVSDPTVKATTAAHAVTDSVLNAMFEQMMACGFTDGLEIGEDRELRRLIWLKVLRRIDQKRDLFGGVVAAATARAPEPSTQAQALIASGLLDVAVGIEDLSATLAESVANELYRHCHASVVRGAIKRAILDLFNRQRFCDLDSGVINNGSNSS